MSLKQTMLDEISMLKQQIESLKCCANCSHCYIATCGTFCLVDCDDKRHSESRVDTMANDVCNKWEAMK